MKREGGLQEVKDRQVKPLHTSVRGRVSNMRRGAHSLPFGGSRLKACRRCLIEIPPEPQPAVAMECNFLRGLPSVNLRAATLITAAQNQREPTLITQTFGFLPRSGRLTA